MAELYLAAEAEGHGADPLDGRYGPPGGRLVSPQRHHLGQAEPHAGERHRPAHQGARVPVPADEVGAVLLRRGCGAGDRAPGLEYDGSQTNGAPASGVNSRRAEMVTGRARRTRAHVRSQHPLGLDHRHPPLSRRPLRRVPARAAGALHQGGLPRRRRALDPFAGSGTVGMVANSLNRRAILIDLNGDYIEQQMKRNAAVPLGLEVA